MIEVLSSKRESAESALRLVPEIVSSEQVSFPEQQFVNFIFFRIGHDYRKLIETEQLELKAEFCSVFDSFRSELLLFSYSLIGFDSKADIMFWRVGRSLDTIQEMTAKLYQTGLGSYLEPADNYLSTTKKMMFVADESGARTHVLAGSTKYHFIYPCAKQSEWGEIPLEVRDQMIEENFMVGKRFPNIKIHLTHAFGFSEQEYLISFETDDPRDFLALAEELRQTPASKFTLRGMPIYTCRQRTLLECLDAVG